MVKRLISVAVVGILLALVAAAIYWCEFKSLKPGQYGIVSTLHYDIFKGSSYRFSYITNDGATVLLLKYPLQNLQIVDTNSTTAGERYFRPIRLKTSDKVEFTVDCTIHFHIAPEKIGYLYRNYGYSLTPFTHASVEGFVRAKFRKFFYQQPYRAVKANYEHSNLLLNLVPELSIEALDRGYVIESIDCKNLEFGALPAILQLRENSNAQEVPYWALQQEEAFRERK